jgi:ATPase subunit of ABC transporter with duplicated ATPase domains
MITAANISLSYGTQILFKEVNIKFTPGNCYGIIGANGAGKSTFLKILSGEIEADTGEVIIGSGQRMAVLRQDHFAFNNYSVLETVIMGMRGSTR